MLNGYRYRLLETAQQRFRLRQIRFRSDYRHRSNFSINSHNYAMKA
jgi:hypothetical protein